MYIEHIQFFWRPLISVSTKNQNSTSVPPKLVISTYGLLTKREVKMAGYWPSSFLRVYGRDEVEVHKLAKKGTRPISSHLDRTNLVNKGFIIWLLVKFCLRDTAGSPERSILPARVANHSARFGLSCPLTELAI